jgi:LPS-assembly protein
VQLLIVILLFLGTQQDQVEISAAGRQEKNGTIARASDNVVITYRDFRVEADDVTYDESTKVVTAGEHIIFTRGEEHLEADHVTFNVETKEGDFTNVRGEIGPGFFITADEAHRTSEGLYQLKNATVTTCCDGPRPGWTMALGRATVDPNRRVTAKNSVLRLENVPIFFMPYMTVPSADRSRSTGFLIPSVGNSTTKGRSIREAFYWAINRSADATITGEYFTKRGIMGGVDFRAVPDGNSYIRIESLFARDRLGQGGRSARIFAYGDFGRGFRGVADMNLVSSFVFRQVYEDGLNIISSPLEHSVAFTSRNDAYMSTNFQFARNGVFFPNEPTVVLRKFPTMEIGFPSRRLGNLPLYFTGETSFAGMSRRDAAIVTPGFVDRLDLHPTIQMPIVHSSLWTGASGSGFGKRPIRTREMLVPSSVTL